jgi:hypothetical protein
VTDEEYINQIDAEAVAHAKGKPWPDPKSVRRIRIEDEVGDRRPSQEAGEARDR